MPKALSREEWEQIKPPLYWIDLTTYKNWNDFHYEVALKWAEQNNESWVYYMKPMFIFGSKEDRFMFQMWAQENFDFEAVGKKIGEI